MKNLIPNGVKQTKTQVRNSIFSNCVSPEMRKRTLDTIMCVLTSLQGGLWCGGKISEEDVMKEYINTQHILGIKATDKNGIEIKQQ